MEKFLSNKITQMEPAKSTKITIKKKKKKKKEITKQYLYISKLLWEQCMASLFNLLKLFYVVKASMYLSTYTRDSTKKIVDLWMAWSTSAIYPDTLEIIVICLAYWERKNKIDANAQFISITRN